MFGATTASAKDGTAAPPLDRLEALVKMRGSIDGRAGFAWIRGVRYAQVGGRLEPMCGLLNCTMIRYRRISPDSFDLRLYEVSFYTDLATGQYAPTLKMPFTGKTVEVPLYRTGPGRHVVKTANSEVMSWSKTNTGNEAVARMIAPDGQIFYDVELSQPTIQADHVWLTTEATTRLEPTDPADKPWFYKELITNHGALKELRDPNVTHVDSTASYTLMMGWRPWMQMDGVDGHTVDHAIGGRVWRLDDLPTDILDHMKRHHPDIVGDPGRWLDAAVP
ncbi:MAG: DUF1838 family protein [Rhodospirillaceae bacterium]|nr:DUF1838 family protein [Rhodospirillaceae bacterium]